MSTDIEILCSCGVCSMRRSIVWLHGARYYNIFYGITVFTSSFGTIPDVVVMCGIVVVAVCLMLNNNNTICACFHFACSKMKMFLACIDGM